MMLLCLDSGEAQAVPLVVARQQNARWFQRRIPVGLFLLFAVIISAWRRREQEPELARPAF